MGNAHTNTDIYTYMYIQTQAQIYTDKYTHIYRHTHNKGGLRNGSMVNTLAAPSEDLGSVPRIHLSSPPFFFFLADKQPNLRFSRVTQHSFRHKDPQKGWEQRSMVEHQPT